MAQGSAVHCNTGPGFAMAGPCMQGSPYRSLLAGLAALCFLLGAPLLAWGQEFPGDDRATLAGTVLDRETGEPIRGVAVRIEGGDRTVVTDADGEFAFQDVAPGTHTLSFRHLTYHDHEESVVVRPGEERVEVTVRLRDSPLEIDPLAVVGEREAPDHGPLAHTYERIERMEQLGLGHFVTRAEIDQWHAIGQPSDIMRSVPGVRLQPDPDGGGPQWEIRRARGADSEGQPCPGPTVYLDDIRIARPEDWGEQTAHPDEFVSSSELEAVEVYRGAAEVPGEYGGPQANCGVVVMSTRRGHDAGEILSETPRDSRLGSFAGALGVGAFLGLAALIHYLMQSD